MALVFRVVMPMAPHILRFSSIYSLSTASLDSASRLQLFWQTQREHACHAVAVQYHEVPYIWVPIPYLYLPPLRTACAECARWQPGTRLGMMWMRQLIHGPVAGRGSPVCALSVAASLQHRARDEKKKREGTLHSVCRGVLQTCCSLNTSCSPTPWPSGSAA